MKKSIKDHSIDLLLIDGNGVFHNRGCGLASQIGYLTNIPSIGIAKNFGGSGLENIGISSVVADKLEQVYFKSDYFKMCLLADQVRVQKLQIPIRYSI